MDSVKKGVDLFQERKRKSIESPGDDVHKKYAKAIPSVIESCGFHYSAIKTRNISSVDIKTFSTKLIQRMEFRGAYNRNFNSLKLTKLAGRRSLGIIS